MFLRLVEQHPRLMMRCSHRASLVGSSLVRVSWCRKGGRWRPHWKLLLVPFKSSALYHQLKYRELGKHYSQYKMCANNLRKRLLVKYIYSDRHPYPSFEKDFKLIFDTLIENKVFSNIPGRNHPSYKFNKSIFEQNSRNELIKKVNTTLKKLI